MKKTLDSQTRCRKLLSLKELRKKNSLNVTARIHNRWILTNQILGKKLTCQHQINKTNGKSAKLAHFGNESQKAAKALFVLAISPPMNSAGK